jgi:hypothetical protein
MPKEEAFVVGSATLSCGECDEPIEVTVSMWTEGERLVAEPDMSGLWLHSWTHREAEKT